MATCTCNSTPCTCSCGCNNINTNPCTASTGCSTTNYAKCIYYSGDDIDNAVEITNGDNLDVVIGVLAAAIDSVVPSDLAWNTFDYDCLGPYSTAQAFAEGISSAHCDLVDRVEDLEKPVFSRCSLFTSGTYLITPGTTTLQTVLEYYGAILCTLAENDPATISVAQGCFSSNAGITTLEDFLNWIVENTCNIKTNLESDISDIEDDVADIMGYLGTSGQLATLHDNSDCLSGGSTDTAYDTIELLKDKVCSINSTLSAMPDLSAITLSWASCYAYGATASLTTQLGRIVAILKQQKYTFSSDFTVTPGTCENQVALAASVGAFACSDLEGCSLTNLGDVDDTAPTIAECGYRWTWDNANGVTKLVKNGTFTNVGVQAKTGLYASESSGFYFKNQVTPLDCSQPLDYQIGFVEDAWLDLTTYIDADYQTSGASTYNPYIKKTWDGHILFKGAVESVSTTISVGSANQPMSNGSYVTVFTGIPAAYRPTLTSFIDIVVEFPHNSNSNLNAFVAGKMQITSTGVISIRCYDEAIATAIGTDYDGEHNFMLFGKSLYQ